MQSEEIRQRFIDFFERRGHKSVASSSLVPEGDASVLFTTAGMQQFKPYYIGRADAEKDFGTKNTASIQKCVRTSDIEEVGDASHLTFFEMLGNFSFGGYWKEEAIRLAYEFITQDMDLKIDYVSVFAGENGVPADTESEKIWKEIDPGLKIIKAGREDNFWGPTGEEGPCGPTTEIYINGVEIWNIVFNEYYQDKAKKLTKLEVPGVDTGMGLERLTVVSQGTDSVFSTDLFEQIVSAVRDVASASNERAERIVADHLRTAVFMIADGVRPSNTERGYILRRLIRRAVRYADDLYLGIEPGELFNVGDAVISKYGAAYPGLSNESEDVIAVIREEEERFRKTLKEGIRQFEKGTDPFILFTTYGFPFELTQELARERGEELDEEEFQKKFKEHQEVSRAGAEQKFKGGLAGHSEAEVRLHTATHLLHQALHDVLGDEVAQRGSNITPERLRFDFTFPRKMTEEEKRQVEEIVNEKIRQALPVQSRTLHKEEAERLGARHFFNERYPDEVSVYYIGENVADAYSKEFCGGPHIENTGVLGKFKITKEEAVSAGTRRIKAVLEND